MKTKERTARLLNVSPLLLLTAAFTLLTLISNAQPDQRRTDSLAAKFKYYNLKQQEGVLFAHFDKTIYTNGESVWFTAYLVNNYTKTDNDVLNFDLVSEYDHSIMFHRKFVMNHNIAFGSLALPDSIPAGRYKFIVYTNATKNGLPQNLFMQPVAIKNVSSRSFDASVILDTTAGALGALKKVTVSVTDKNGQGLKKVIIMAFIGDKPVPARLNTNVKDSREYLINVPQQYLEKPENVLTVKIAQGSESFYKYLNIPGNGNKTPDVKFFPEGGWLAAGLMSVVGWQVDSLPGYPLKCRALLFEGDQLLDTINTDNHGMGRFFVKPSTDKKYMVRLLNRPGTYFLPDAVNDQPEITIKDAVAGDTLYVKIRSKETGRFNLLIHNFRNLYYEFPIDADENGKLVKVALSQVPKGIAEVTLLDNLQRPRAERLFFAHYNDGPKLSIITEKLTYGTREKINVKLNMENKDGASTPGLVSVACVQLSRIPPENSTDIERYFYFENDLGPIPLADHYAMFGNADRAQLENILLIKGWRRYSWVGLQNATAKDTLAHLDSLAETGTVGKAGQTLKAPLDLILVKSTGVKDVTTDLTGAFTLNNEALYAKDNSKLYFLPVKKDILASDIKINDPYREITKNLVKNISGDDRNHINPDESADLNGFQHTIMLKAVSIKAFADREKVVERANACGDYVCRYNFLNCPVHPYELDNKPPVKGHAYNVYNGPLGKVETSVYWGCVIEKKYDTSSPVEGIYYAREFAGPNYDLDNPPEPELRSTLYWKHLLNVPKDKNAEFSFFTGDITGPFAIVVQGVSDDGVVYAERTVFVKKSAR